MKETEIEVLREWMTEYHEKYYTEYINTQK